MTTPTPNNVVLKAWEEAYDSRAVCAAAEEAVTAAMQKAVPAAVKRGITRKKAAVAEAERVVQDLAHALEEHVATEPPPDGLGPWIERRTALELQFTHALETH